MNEKVSEDEVWQDLANLYAKLSHWRDAEVCLQKATSLKPFSASSLHTQGLFSFYNFSIIVHCIL
jgi:tetratricopeptide repeat protein 7